MENNNAWWVGIDPGLSGGIVVLSNDGRISLCKKMPETDKDIIELLEPYSWINGVSGTSVCIEKIWGHEGYPGSKHGVFNQGMNYGMLKMACIALRMRMDEVTPQKWQKLYSLKKEKGMEQKLWKAQLKDRAQKMFPDQKVTNYTADALLIAGYCRRLFSNPMTPDECIEPIKDTQ